jgi:hypothetical protein
MFSNQILRKLLIHRVGAGNENRTRIASLEGWSFTIKLCPRVIERGKMLPWTWQMASRFFCSMKMPRPLWIVRFSG